MPEESSTTLETSQPIETKPTNWPKIIAAVVLSLGLLVAAAYAGYWCGTESAKLKLKTQIQETPILEDTTSPTKPLTDSSNWQEKAYPNLGISLKVPPDWIVKKEEVNSVEFCNYNPETAVGISPGFEKGNLKLVVNLTSTAQTVSEYLQKQKEDSRLLWGEDLVWETASTTLDGQPATRLETGPYRIGFGVITKHPTKETIIDLSFGADFNNYLELASQILSTFKFLD